MPNISQLTTYIDDKTHQVRASGELRGFDFEKVSQTPKRIAEAVNKTIQVDIDKNTEKVNAVSKLQEKVKSFLDLMQKLKTSIPKLGEESTQLFSNRTITGTSTDGSNLSDNVDIISSFKTPITSFTMVINQLARIDVQTSSQSTLFTSPAQSVSFSGTFVLQGQTIDLAGCTTIQNVIDTINAKSGDTNVTVEAQYPTSGSTDLFLKFKAVNTAVPIDFVGTDPTTLETLQLSSFTATPKANLQAKVTVDGVQYTRDTNAIKDIITGTEIDLKRASPTSPTTTLQVNINSGFSMVGAALNQIKDARNSIFDDLAALTQEKGLLYGDFQFAHSIRTLLTDPLNLSVTGLDHTVQLTTALDIGISINPPVSQGSTTIPDNKTYIDVPTLDDATFSKFDQVRQLVTSNVISSDINFKMTGLPENMANVAGKQVSFKITCTNGTSPYQYVAIATMGGIEYPLTIVGNTLYASSTLPDGSAHPLKGLYVTANGALPTTQDGTLQSTSPQTLIYGFGAQLCDNLQSLLYADPNPDPTQRANGLFESFKEKLINVNKTKQDRIDKNNKIADTKVEQLRKNFAKLNTQLDQLKLVKTFADAYRKLIFKGND